MGSNRTFMELKFQKCFQGCTADGCSNRTFMELKSRDLYKTFRR